MIGTKSPFAVFFGKRRGPGMRLRLQYGTPPACADHFSSIITEGGTLKFYVGEGELTEAPIPADCFGCAGVAKIARFRAFSKPWAMPATRIMWV